MIYQRINVSQGIEKQNKKVKEMSGHQSCSTVNTPVFPERRCDGDDEFRTSSQNSEMAMD